MISSKSMETALGMLYKISENEKEYCTLVIKINQAYQTIFMKFNVWNIEKYKTSFGDDFKEGVFVELEYYKSKNFARLNSIKLTSVSTCFECGAYTPERNNQQTECEMCFGLIPKAKVCGIHTVVTKQIKAYKYSSGLSLGFLQENGVEDRKLILTTVFENNPMFKDLDELDIGKKVDVDGWVTKENDDGSKFASLSSVPVVIN